MLSFRIIVVFSLVLFVLSFVVHRASAYTFTSNLKLGDRGADVKELQIALNSNQSTMIALTGPGSPGNETDYFGVLTKSAVLRFQELYRPDILVPAGVTSPTGFVGALTRLKLNNLSPKTAFISSQITLPVNAKVPSLPEDKPTRQDLVKFGTSISQMKPVILGLSRYEAGRKDSVTIYGQGFSSEDNKIHFGNSASFASAKSSNSSELVFTVPESVSFGSYYLWVENLNGSSFVENGNNFFSVAEFPHQAPSITNINPSKIAISSLTSPSVTVMGANFSQTSNDIYSSIGIINNVPSSDGKTLTFSLSGFERIKEVMDMKKFVSKGNFPIPIVVKTDYGFSSATTQLIVEF